MNIGAYFYNHNLQDPRGKMEAVLNIKTMCPTGWPRPSSADYERGLTSEIMPYPWQSETCIGDWHYDAAFLSSPVNMVAICIHGRLSTGWSMRSARMAHFF